MTLPTELQRAKLTYAELLNILCILAVRLERMETLMGDLLKDLDTQTEFQTYQILLTRSEMLRYNDKVPSRRLNDLEKQFNGLIQFVNQKREKPRRQSKYS